jgi:starvation-inducible outer membrane lipoprotein
MNVRNRKQKKSHALKKLCLLPAGCTHKFRAIRNRAESSISKLYDTKSSIYLVLRGQIIRINGICVFDYYCLMCD